MQSAELELGPILSTLARTNNEISPNSSKFDFQKSHMATLEEIVLRPVVADPGRSRPTCLNVP